MRYLLLLSACAALDVMATPITVMIDPGHGGRDRGTTRQDIHEAEINLNVARHLRDLLKENSGFNVLMTRTTDATVTLNERSRLAKAKQAELFISIHVNSSPDLKARGAEFYFQNQLPLDEESMFMAHQEELGGTPGRVQPVTYPFLDSAPYPSDVSAILKDLLDSSRVQRSSDLARALRIHWNGPRKSQMKSIHQAPFHVLSQMPVPSALVEIGFLTNPFDYQVLTSSTHQKRMAEDLYQGLLAYKDSLDKAIQSP